MNFQVKDLRQILYSIRANNIYRLNIKSKKFELLINKNNITTNNNSKIIKTKYSNNINETLTKPESQINNIQYSNTKNNQIHSHESISYSTIISPMVGTFYRSPAPNEPPFVEKYDIVDKKQTVCIIEAMKLMNEIEAEVNGKIVEILVQDGEIVDCGQALMKVQKI
uniref:Biotin carboxyl carrier protein of acetyl-CoA carboxylase n=1 Tax=Gracilariopsis tenuifrons TaxID=31472 RepID=A0A345AI57_9FLOR|nr:acetyl-CoA carboxylase, biotin carboxyl carrier protein [Gracilariopsis tenuifrons]AXF36093.1 acetyl-CoA carboxylase, biotin carboxyl carrier protein [Gracilariopsis tenuifrons]UAD89282.1 acetyl-CoA carboxylase, biotin carboxyl carrier protein [Gracilariopsis tenuifrons]